MLLNLCFSLGAASFEKGLANAARLHTVRAIWTKMAWMALSSQ